MMRGQGGPPPGYLHGGPSSRRPTGDQGVYIDQSYGATPYGRTNQIEPAMQERSPQEIDEQEEQRDDRAGYNMPVPPLNDYPSNDTPYEEVPQTRVLSNPEFGDAASPELALLSEYTREPSDRQRDPASFGFSGRQPSPGRPARASSPAPPIPATYADGLPGQAVEMDANYDDTNGVTTPMAHPTDIAHPVELMTSELGPQAPAGDHSAG